LVEDFVGSPEGRVVPDAEKVAQALVEYRAGHCEEDPPRWSPIVVELLLLDWFPRKMTWDGGLLTGFLEALTAWVRYAGRRKGCPHT
jgi:hypothetical protein